MCDEENREREILDRPEAEVRQSKASGVVSKDQSPTGTSDTICESKACNFRSSYATSLVCSSLLLVWASADWTAIDEISAIAVARTIWTWRNYLVHSKAWQILGNSYTIDFRAIQWLPTPERRWCCVLSLRCSMTLIGDNRGGTRTILGRICYEAASNIN